MINASLHTDVSILAHQLSQATRAVFSLASIFADDESIYKWVGANCPVRYFIPRYPLSFYLESLLICRKPNPNGLQNFGSAQFVFIGDDKLPILVDSRPCTVQHRPSAQGAALEMTESILEVFTTFIHAASPLILKDCPHPHKIQDSAFGSFQRIEEYREMGATATMSMSANTSPWLWAMLSDGCGIDEGRTAYNPETKLLASCFTVLSESGKVIQIKTIATGFTIDPPMDEEDLVANVNDRRTGIFAYGEGTIERLEYSTKYCDGTNDWLTSDAFFSDDGTCNSSWLSFASREDIDEAIDLYTGPKLKEMCTGQEIKSTGNKWKMRFDFLIISSLPHYPTNFNDLFFLLYLDSLLILLH